LHLDVFEQPEENCFFNNLLEGRPVRMSMRAAVEQKRRPRKCPGRVCTPPNRCCAGIKFLGDAADDTNSITISGLSGTDHGRPGWKEWQGVKMYFFGLHFFACMALSPQHEAVMQGGGRKGEWLCLNMA
jgi:hypothetical protein